MYWSWLNLHCWAPAVYLGLGRKNIIKLKGCQWQIKPNHTFDKNTFKLLMCNFGSLNLSVKKRPIKGILRGGKQSNARLEVKDIFQAAQKSCNRDFILCAHYETDSRFWYRTSLNPLWHKHGFFELKEQRQPINLHLQASKTCLSSHKLAF